MENQRLEWADSLNAGLNVCRNDLVVSIDADSIMEPDALLKMVKPFILVQADIRV